MMDDLFKSFEGKHINCAFELSGNVYFIIEGITYYMFHHDDCCEDVELIDIVGDMNDLTNAEIVFFRHDTNDELEAPEDFNVQDDELWNFYNIQTNKGHVQIRWFGTSSGYYSIDVDFEEYPFNCDYTNKLIIAEIDKMMLSDSVNDIKNNKPEKVKRRM